MKQSSGKKIAAQNRRAKFDYNVLDNIECGIVLSGSEVKSIRESSAQMEQSYAMIDSKGEVWLTGMHVAPWTNASAGSGHEPDRPRKLLLKRAEIMRLKARVDQDRLQLIPLSLYFSHGILKIDLAIAKGKRLHDKRESIKKRESDREASQAMRETSRSTRVK